MPQTGDTTLYDQWLAVQARFAAEEAAVAPPVPEPPAADAIGRALRHDGWTPDRQRRFIELIAEGCTVIAACRTVGLSTASAYALRARASGQVFALGWNAANLLAREPLADGLIARALDGQVERRTLPNGDVVERHRYDNGLATRMLARLDRQAEAQGPADHLASRLVAAEFDAFLDLIGRGEGPARAGLFLAPRASGTATADLAPIEALARIDRFIHVGAGLASEVPNDDLDLAARATWTGEQWLRAEAAGLLRVAPEPQPEQPSEPQQRKLVPDESDTWPRVWWDEDIEEWRTDFPPPEGFAGDERQEYGQDFYDRSLTDAELAAVEKPRLRELARERETDAAERERWFAGAAAALESSDEGDQDRHHVVAEGENPPCPAPSCERAVWADLEGEDRPDRQHDGRDGQHAAGQRFHDAHCGSPGRRECRTGPICE